MLPGRLLAEKLCTQDEHFTISNSLFNFNFLAPVDSEILGAPKFTLCVPAPTADFFGTQNEHFTISNSVLNFSFLALVVSEILEWSQICIRGPYPPGSHLVE